MKQNNTIIIFLVIIILSNSNYGCKEKNYQGNVVFWYGENTAEKLVENGISNLTFYLDGKIIGSSASNIYCTSAPSCGDNGSISATKDLGNMETQAYSYKVVDENGIAIWDGVVNINADRCLQMELTWDSNKKLTIKSFCNCKTLKNKKL